MYNAGPNFYKKSQHVKLFGQYKELHNFCHTCLEFRQQLKRNRSEEGKATKGRWDQQIKKYSEKLESDIQVWKYPKGDNKQDLL